MLLKIYIDDFLVKFNSTEFTISLKVKNRILNLISAGHKVILVTNHSLDFRDYLEEYFDKLNIKVEDIIYDGLRFDACISIKQLNIESFFSNPKTWNNSLRENKLQMRPKIKSKDINKQYSDEVNKLKNSLNDLKEDLANKNKMLKKRPKIKSKDVFKKTKLDNNINFNNTEDI